MQRRAAAVSTDQAAACVGSGMHPFVHGAAATPTPLLEPVIGIAHPNLRRDLEHEIAAARHFVITRP